MIWLILFLVFIILEVITFNLITVWFAFGSMIAYIASLFVKDFNAQIYIFVISSIILLLFTRRIIKKYFKVKKVSTNIDRIIGNRALVTDAINRDIIGEVKVDGKLFSAFSDDEFKQGEYVKILSIEGVKLKVGRCN